MEQKDTQYYEDFENNLMTKLLGQLISLQALDGTLLDSDDITARWHDLAPEYMADAVPQLNSYPAAAIAWAAYVGMAVAHRWDEDWILYSTEPYTDLLGPRGFDDMDEHIVQNILKLKLESPEATRIEEIMRGLAQTAITTIRHEQVEGQTTQAFYIFARTTRVMFRLGAAMELYRLGYRFEKVNMGAPEPPVA